MKTSLEITFFLVAFLAFFANLAVAEEAEGEGEAEGGAAQMWATPLMLVFSTLLAKILY